MTRIPPTAAAPGAFQRGPGRYPVLDTALRVILMLAVAFNGLVAGPQLLAAGQADPHAAVHGAASGHLDAGHHDAGDHGAGHDEPANFGSADSGPHDAACHDVVTDNAGTDCQPDSECAAVCAHAAALLPDTGLLAHSSAARLDDRAAERRPSFHSNPPIRPPIAVPA